LQKGARKGGEDFEPADSGRVFCRQKNYLTEGTKISRMFSLAVDGRYLTVEESTVENGYSESGKHGRRQA